VLQRGASNLYFPVMESALDIPPWTRTLERILGDYWDSLVDIPDLENRVRYIEMSETLQRVLARAKMAARSVAERFEDMRRDIEQLDPTDLKIDEYRVFTAGADENDPEFETCSEPVPANIRPWIDRVLRVARLREVRVARGFTRIDPPFESEEAEAAPLSAAPLDWLPAIEVRGEGIFFRLDLGALAEWETRPEVLARVAVAERSWAADWARRHPEVDKPFPASPRRLLVHSLSHALMLQLTLECGYSTASLRERLYIGEGPDGMAGVLIYTATPDSDGTLGGLQRRAMCDLLGPTFEGALRSAQWCSSDPLCIAGQMAAPEAHSVASCHACSLVPETSCELHNGFLDRGLLVGTDADPDIGYFSPMLRTRA